jgi:glutamyl-tRNA synthetase
MEAMRNYLCLLGWAPGDDREMLTLDEMISEFRLEDVNNSPAFFDVKKLSAFNQRYIQAMTDREFIDACRPFVERGPWPPEQFDQTKFDRLAPLLKERVRTLGEVPDWVDFVFRPEPVIDPASWDKAVVRVAQAPDLLSGAIDAYAIVPWESAALHDVTQRLGEAHGLALGKAQAPLRVAVTGRTVGPPLFESLEVLGRDTTLARLKAARARLDAG